MVAVLPLSPTILALNILCRALTCRYPFQYPEIKYDHSQDAASLKYGNTGGIKRSLNHDNYFDVSTSPEPNVVSTAMGGVEGYYMTTSGGRKIGAYEGIRYAKAERWRTAKLVESWRGTIEAKSPGPSCLQFHVERFMRIFGQEDCLFLNVYSPVISGNKRNAKLPVVVHIHGGAFTYGSGSEYGPSYLLNEDLLLVTFNYRLGVLGFMSTGDKVLPGNWGMHDQVLAIEWVRRHIAHFGGDPSRIVLWGYSAGGVSAHLHMMSNLTKHKLYKAISQSGSAFAPWAVFEPWRARLHTDILAEIFNCSSENSQELVVCMRGVDPISLVAAQTRIPSWFPLPPTIFGPTVEEVGHDQSPFLTAMPETLYKAGEVAPIPWISSITQDEGLSAILLLEMLHRWSATKLRWHRIAKHVLDLDYLHLSNLPKVVAKITEFYFKGPKQTAKGSVFEYSEMITDRYFHVPFVKAVQAHSQLAPTYAYLFRFHNGSYNIGNLNLHTAQEWGAGHGEEAYYTFNSTVYFPGFKRSNPEFKLSKFLVNLATHFIYSATPTFNPKRRDESKGSHDAHWLPVTNPSNISILEIDDEIKMSKFNQRRVKFWHDLKLPDAMPWTNL